MKKKLIFTVICLSVSFSCFAQQEENSTKYDIGKRVQLGLGISFGFFSPNDVNNFIEDEELNSSSTYIYYTQSGSTNMILNLSIKPSLNFIFSRYFGLALEAEYSYAPKIVSGGSGDGYYAFSKFSPGIVPKIYMPMGSSGRNAFYIAPGATYNILKFEDYKSAVFGGKVELGLSLRAGKSRLQPHIAYVHAKGTDSNNIGGSVFELNYSTVQIGIDFLF